MSAGKWIKIFKTGTHKDSKGREHTVTTQDLDDRVTLYNDQREDVEREAPLTLGHPVDNDPSYGWVKKLKRSGEFLLAYCEQINEDFKEAVNNGSYKFKSASFYPNGLLRHVGFLGAVQPAIAGLGAASFADAEDAVVFDDFMDWDISWRMNRIADLIQRVREWIIEQHDIETANKVITSWDIENLRPPPEINPDFKEQTTSTEDDMELKEQVEKLTSDFNEAKTENAALKSTNDKLSTQVSGLEKQVADLTHQNVKRDIENFCDGLIKAEKMSSDERDFYVQDLMQKASMNSADFSEGESPYEMTKKHLEARVPKPLLTEVATRSRAATIGVSSNFSSKLNVDEESSELDAKVERIMKEKGITNYAEALDLATEE